MYSTQFLIIFKHFICNSSSYSIFCCYMFFFFRSNSWLIPFFAVSFRPLLFSLDLALEGGTGSSRPLWLWNWFVWIDTFLFLLLWLSLSILNSLIPLFSNLLLPVLILFDFSNSVFNDCKCLFDFEVVHVLIIVKIVCEFKELINFLLLILFLLFLSRSPCRLLTAFFWLLRSGYLWLSRHFLHLLDDGIVINGIHAFNFVKELVLFFQKVWVILHNLYFGPLSLRLILETLDFSLLHLVFLIHVSLFKLLSHF